MLNKYRHYFLYAKGHYLIEDMFSDLKKIQCHYVGCDIGAHITKGDFIRVTTDAVKSLRSMITVDKYVEALLHYGKLKVDPFNDETHNVVDAVILTNLGILRFATIYDIDGELGEIDTSILPSSKQIKEG